MPYNIPRSKAAWASYTSTRRLVVLIMTAVALIAAGLLMSAGPVSCGGRRMQPGDKCVNYRSGVASSYDQMSSAPIRQFWIYLVIAILLLAVAAVLYLRRKAPAESEVVAFLTTVAQARHQLVAAGRSKTVLDRFDRQVDDELKRVGASVPRLLPRPAAAPLARTDLL